MFHHVDERLSGLALFLCEQNIMALQEIRRVFMENPAKMYRSGFRCKSR